MGKHIICCLSLAFALASCNQDTSRRDDFALHGIDVSHHQSFIDWPAVASQDIHFAFVKATEGATMVDSIYCRNWSDMQASGIRRGAYHFFRPSVPVAMQVNNFTNWVEMDYGDLPPVLDVEVIDGASKVSLIVGIKTWLYLVELRYGVKPILYTNLKFYNRYLAGHFDNHPLWIARYNSREPTLACGREWHFWQYGNRGRLDGIKGFVDFNVFQGDSEDMDRICLKPPTVLSEDDLLACRH
jgi:lysozyme